MFRYEIRRERCLLEGETGEEVLEDGVGLGQHFVEPLDRHVRLHTTFMCFKLPWREAGPPDQHDDKVDSDQ